MKEELFEAIYNEDRIEHSEGYNRVKKLLKDAGIEPGQLMTVVLPFNPGATTTYTGKVASSSGVYKGLKDGDGYLSGIRLSEMYSTTKDGLYYIFFDDVVDILPGYVWLAYTDNGELVHVIENDENGKVTEPYDKATFKKSKKELRIDSQF